MKIPLITSIVILTILGLRSATSIPGAFTHYQYGDLAGAARLGSILGAFISVFLMFGLAYGQWRTRGRLGLGISIFAAIILTVQSLLMYLAVSSGRIQWNGAVATKFVLFITGVLVLAVSSVVAYAQRPKKQNGK